MTKLRPFLVLALVVLVASPALATPEDGVPIKGTVIGVDTMNAPTGCDPIQGGSDFDAQWLYRSTGTGNISHLGRVDFVVEHCSYIDFATGTGVFDNGTTTFVAANGDTLVLSHSGSFAVVGPFSYIDMNWNVAGGTGRFADATGSGTANPLGDLVAGTTTASFTGFIDYDASKVRN
jgi:hypothetical protein